MPRGRKPVAREWLAHEGHKHLAAGGCSPWCYPERCQAKYRTTAATKQRCVNAPGKIWSTRDKHDHFQYVVCRVPRATKANSPGRCPLQGIRGETAAYATCRPKSSGVSEHIAHLQQSQISQKAWSCFQNVPAASWLAPPPTWRLSQGAMYWPIRNGTK